MMKLCYILILFFFVSCSRESKKETQPEYLAKDNLAFMSDKKEAEDSINQNWDDLAAIIAGSSCPDDSISELHFFTRTEEWQNYHDRADSLWRRFSTEVVKIQEWQLRNLSEKNLPDTVYYPFSGPDLPYLFLFYPHASYYYLFALEPIGSIPSFSYKEEGKDMFDRCSLYFKAVSDVLSFSFFRTNDMKVDFSSSLLDGVLPVFLFFLNRMDYHILSVNYGRLSSSGSFKKELSTNEAVEITFRDPRKNRIKKLCYVTCNLSNRGIKENHSLEMLLDRKNYAVLVKSASYLMHNSGFSKIRNKILSNSSFIIQDDSGIPFSKFFDHQWTVDLYGNYTRPIPLFRRYYQEDLAGAYRDSLRRKILDFRIGYGIDYNLMVATRR